MPRHREQLISILRRSVLPLDDDELARCAEIHPRQSVNQLCRRLADEGVLRRFAGPAGKIVNELVDGVSETPIPQAAGTPDTRPVDASTGGRSMGVGTWRVTDGAGVAFGDARRLWASAARETLIDVARRYHAYITYGELAEQVQQRSGVRTRSQLRNWIGKVLADVVQDCHHRGEPPLTALCVHQDQSVGDGYAYVLHVAGLPVPEDLDAHAAEARLECHRFFGAQLPTDGGRPALPPAVVAARRRAARAVTPPAAICPSCFTVLPKTGRCDTCS